MYLLSKRKSLDGIINFCLKDVLHSTILLYLQKLNRWLHQPQGMIIFTGPTGSGKTSTLYTSLQAIASENVNVTTVEDPVEYVLSNITKLKSMKPQA